MKSRLIFFAFGLVSFIATLTYSQPVLAQETFPRILERILQGTETTDYPSVGIVGSVRNGGFCTGTLISPTHVLTAAHCAEVIEEASQGTFQLDDQIYETTSISIHPDYNSFSLANDIALLTLSEPVLDVAPATIFRSTPIVGDVLLIVGFGGGGTAEDGSDGFFGTKRVGVTIVDEVTDTLVSWNFDDPSESNTASGDSGGPGFLDVDGDLFVACVTSGGTEPDSGLGDFAFNTRVDAFADWIDATIATADDPTDDDPSDDPGSGDDSADDDESFCDFSGPFPFLQCLISLLTDLLDYLNDQQAAETETSDGEAATSDSQTFDEGDVLDVSDVTADSPTTDTPTTETPVVDDSETPVVDDSDSENQVDCPAATPDTETETTDSENTETPDAENEESGTEEPATDTGEEDPVTTVDVSDVTTDLPSELPTELPTEITGFAANSTLANENSTSQEVFDWSAFRVGLSRFTEKGRTFFQDVIVPLGVESEPETE